MTISIQVPKLPIETPEDHKAVLARIDALMDAEAGSDEAVELAVLGMLCAQYEREAFPIDPPSPIDAIRFRMEQGGYTQADLARVLGSQSSTAAAIPGASASPTAAE